MMKRQLKKIIAIAFSVITLVAVLVPDIPVAAAGGEYNFTTVAGPSGEPLALYGINPSGDVVGVIAPVGPGFTLINGKYETFTYPGGLGTSLIGISPSGSIVGDYQPAGTAPGVYHWHGFMITKKGDVIDIDDGIHDTLVPFRVLPDGTIIGHVQKDVPNPLTRYGFVIHPDGSFEYNTSMPFSQHNAATPNGKTIVGSYMNMNLGKFCGYVLENGNLVKTFDIPGSSMTLAWDINPAGNVVVGWYAVGSYPWPEAHGFIAEKRGCNDWEITDFDVPGATWTCLQAINPGGELAGRYVDGTGIHGFIASTNNRK